MSETEAPAAEYGLVVVDSALEGSRPRETSNERTRRNVRRRRRSRARRRAILVRLLEELDYVRVNSARDMVDLDPLLELIPELRAVVSRWPEPDTSEVPPP